MKKIISLFTMILLAVCLLWTGTSQPPAHAAGIELSYQAIYPERHIVVRNAVKPWFKSVEEMSGGKLKLIYFPPGAIVKQPETFDAVKMGIVDLGGTNTGRNPGKFPLNSIVTLPLLFPNSRVASEVVWKLSQEFPEWKKEFAGTTLLWQFTSAPVQIITTKKQIQSLEDLKGMKIICWVPIVLQIVKALGANPIQVPPPDTYLALERGMADGVATAIPAMRPFKLNEVTKFVTLADVMVSTFYVVMNPSKMEGLPPDLQKILTDSTGIQMARFCGETLDKGAVKDIGWLKSQGFQFHTLSSVEKPKWVKAVMPIRDSWLKKMEGKGYKNIRKILERAQKLAAELQ